MEESAAPSGSLLRGLALLDAVTSAPTPLSLAELADHLRLDSSTVYRLAQVLLENGYLVRHEAGKRYIAGPKALSVGSNYHPLNVFRRETSETLRQARDETGETIGLVLFIGTERLLVDIAQGREALAPFYDTWLRSPLHGSASGKILLMSMTPEARAQLLGPGPLAAFTPHTITDPAVLEQRLAQGRQDGFIISANDAFMGMTAVAAPIYWNNRVLGCLAMAGSSSRIGTEAALKIAHVLKDAATLISRVTPSATALARFVGL